ncbi:F-box only protein 27 isoform X3 [Sorex araneus]|uniref:F-box only protein 27 isoform X3 n=1 Tax=Sorex araneus TaxID=42254 RepID=UPI002433EDDC|nr:F-box only protein 27 isoform X3 [Sorex araneus]
MGALSSRAPAARAPAAPSPPEKGPDLSQLPPELLLLVLSHVPPRVLLRRCRLVCRGWRALVDGQALWLLLVAREHGALLPLVRSCLPRARAAGPALLGRFCELRPLGRNLIRNPCGQGPLSPFYPPEGFRKWMVRHDGNGWVVEQNRTSIPGAPSQTCFVSSYRWCHKKQVLDLEEEGLWPELLDSGKIEICVSDWKSPAGGAGRQPEKDTPGHAGLPVPQVGRPTRLWLQVPARRPASRFQLHRPEGILSHARAHPAVE